MPQAAAIDLFSLSIPEKIQLVEDLWDSIAVHPEKVTLSPHIKAELDERLKDLELHPEDASTWDDVRSRLWKAL